MGFVASLAAFGDRIDRQYTRFRGTWWFVGLLIGWTAGWFIARHFFGIDPRLEELNTQYSIEATIAGAFMSMEVNRAAQAAKRVAAEHNALLMEIRDNQRYAADLMEALLEASENDEHDN